jgi:hypothetical protein
MILLNAVNKIDYHFHVKERTIGKRNPQTATQWLEVESLNPFVATSGANAFGAAGTEALVIGSADTPLILNSSNTKFDMRIIVVVGSNKTTPYILRIIWGTGTMAQAIASGQYSNLVVQYDSYAGVWTDINMEHLPIGTKVWVQTKCGAVGTIDFLASIHEYII